MISFVWSSKYPFLSGAGGSENYTAGQIRELQRRGYACRIITVGHGQKDGRTNFPDIEFYSVDSAQEVTELDDTLIFITYPLPVKTKHQSYVILHCPPPKFMQDDDQFDPAGLKGKRIIATSRFAMRLWSAYYPKTIVKGSIVYPFADEAFGAVTRRTDKGKPTRILFAGRLKADKGIYTLMAALHMADLRDTDITVTATTAGRHEKDGKIIAKLVRAHPKMKLIPARRTPAQMASLMADFDIVVAPSTNIFWQETFGMVSVEAQHAGCRVVASKAGGLRETDCGGLVLVKPDDPVALAAGIKKAVELGPLTKSARATAKRRFIIKESVDDLLRIVKPREAQPRTERLHEPLMQFPSLPGQWKLLGRHSKP